MLAVLVNFAAVLLGGFVGLMFGKTFKREVFREVLKAIGLAVIVFGLLGIIREMVLIEEGLIKTRHELLLLLSLAAGIFIGETLKLHSRMETFGNFLESKLKAKQLSKGFVTSTMIFISGAMAIVGSIRAGLGDPEVLYLKAMIDGITALLLASALGSGVLLSAASVLIYQGLIACLAHFFGDYISSEFISAFGAVGYALLVAVGIDLLFKNKLKPVNLTPALAVCALYFLVKWIVGMF